MGREDGILLWVGGKSEQELKRIPLEAGETARFDEAWLQRLIHEHPRCLPMHEIDSSFDGPFAVCMEFPTKHGPVDNLLITADGNIVVVEAKLWRNPEARRKVVAQALDYAACIFEMTYSELETAALQGQFGIRAKPRNLYDLIPESLARPEAEFVDAVTRNLRKGRILILVVGDGIRADFERLASSLQSHAGFHFTFALVELAVYRAPTDGELVVQPRTLGKTVMVERGIVQIDDRRVTVALPATAHTPSGRGPAVSISSEQFFEAMGARNPELPARLKEFLAKLEDVQVYPEFLKSLNLRWDTPSGRSINLGYIKRDGQVWTDNTDSVAPLDLSRSYIEDLAQALGLEIEKVKLVGHWHVRKDGKAPKIETLMDRLDLWAACAARFVERLRAYYASVDQ